MKEYNWAANTPRGVVYEMKHPGKSPTPRAVIDKSFPEGTLREADIVQLLADNRHATAGVRISLKGKFIGGTLGNLKSDDIMKLDFSGAHLEYANITTIMQWKSFRYDAETTFPDTLNEDIVDRVQKRTKIPIKLVAVDSLPSPYVGPRP